MAKFSLGEIAQCVGIGDFNAGELVEVIGIGPFMRDERDDSEIEDAPADYLIIRPGGDEYYDSSFVDECHLRKLPGQSKEDQEARERFLKGCHEKPNFHEILSDLQPVTEEKVKQVFESMWSVK